MMSPAACSKTGSGAVPDRHSSIHYREARRSRETEPEPGDDPKEPAIIPELSHRAFRQFPLAALILLLGFAAAAAAAAPLPRASAPFVMFRLEQESVRSAADQCAEVWRKEGAALTTALLPATIAPDTVECLLLTTESFNAHFAGRLPDWGVGVAVPSGRLVAMDVSRIPAIGRGVREVFLHEMVHALLFQGAGEAWLPTWFHEGLAMLYSGEWRFSDTVSLALDGRVPRLDRLQGRFPASAAGADRAYRTSLLAVNRLLERYGPDTARRLVEETARSGDFEAAFLRVTGVAVDSFARDFDSAMNLRYGWLVTMTRWPGLFVLTALLFAVGAVRKIVISRRRMAAMDDEVD